MDDVFVYIGLAGLMSGTLLYSLDFARTRLANDVLNENMNSRQFTGLIDVYRKTIKGEGIAGLYRGFGVTCFSIVLYRGLYFGIYDTVKLRDEHYNNKKNNYGKKFIVGFGASSLASIIVYPLDSIRRRLMMTTLQSYKYDNAMQLYQVIIMSEGYYGLYKGCLVNIVRNLCGAGTLVGFDIFSQHYMDWKFGIQQD